MFGLVPAFASWHQTVQKHSIGRFRVNFAVHYSSCVPERRTLRRWRCGNCNLSPNTFGKVASMWSAAGGPWPAHVELPCTLRSLALRSPVMAAARWRPSPRDKGRMLVTVKLWRLHIWALFNAWLHASFITIMSRSKFDAKHSRGPLNIPTLTSPAESTPRRKEKPNYSQRMLNYDEMRHAQAIWNESFGWGRKSFLANAELKQTATWLPSVNEINRIEKITQK